MPLRTLLTFAILLTTISTATTYPQADHPNSTSPLALLLPPPTNLTAPPSQIRCVRNLTRPTTNVATCRPTLNLFRTFPNYRRFQSFQEGRFPTLPHPPPYAVHQAQSSCAVQLASRDPAVVDDFSFEQARALATDILEACEGEGWVRGGVAPIGHDLGWRVVVVGLRRGLVGGLGEGGGLGSGEDLDWGIGDV